MRLTKLNIVGRVYLDVFQDGEATVEVPTTAEAYVAVGAGDAPSPVSAGKTWLRSYSDYRYDSASGRMEDDCYARNEGDGFYLVKLAGCGMVSVDLADIDAEGDLDAAREALIRSDFHL